MEQDYYVRPIAREKTIIHIESTEPEETKAQSEKRKIEIDPNLKIVIMQFIICAVIIFAALVIKMFFGGYFNEIKNWYNENVNIETDINQVIKSKSDEKEKSGENDISQVIQTSAVPSNETQFLLPVSGKLTSYFGTRIDPISGEIAEHHGIDIAAESGTKILSALPGTVSAAEKSSGDYGNYVIIDHGGFSTLYAHCSELLVKKNEKVDAGKVVALCGSTGRSTGPHLHFEVRIGEKRIDPLPFLSRLEK